jgi:hypothetical protein
MLVRVIALDIEASNNISPKEPFVIAVGIAYIDCEIGTKDVSNFSSKRFQLHNIKFPSRANQCVFDKQGKIVDTPDDYGSYDRDTWECFWATDKVSDNLRRDLLIPASHIIDDAPVWREIRDTVDLYVKTAPGKVVVVSDNPAFDIGVIDAHLRPLSESAQWSLLYLPTGDTGYKYNSIRSPNTAWKLRRKGVLIYDDVKIDTTHSHYPEDDALYIAKDYVSFITTYGME